MWSETPLELRVEVYADGELPAVLADQIGAVLARHWPVEWDVDIPTHSTFDHPAEWRAVVPHVEGTTPQTLHRQLAAELIALDPSHPLHLRTRWDFPQAPDQREVYEEGWKPKGH